MDEYEEKPTKPMKRVLYLLMALLVLAILVIFQVVYAVPHVIDPTFAERSMIEEGYGEFAANKEQPNGAHVFDDDFQSLKNMFSRKAYRKTKDYDCNYVTINFYGNNKSLAVYLSEDSSVSGKIIENGKDFYFELNSDEIQQLSKILYKYGISWGVKNS